MNCKEPNITVSRLVCCGGCGARIDLEFDVFAEFIPRKGDFINVIVLKGKEITISTRFYITQDDFDDIFSGLVENVYHHLGEITGTSIWITIKLDHEEDEANFICQKCNPSFFKNFHPMCRNI